MWALMGLAFASGPPISGTWTLAETGASLDAKHDQALQDALAQLPWAFRGLAKGRLAKPIDNCERVILGLEGDRFHAQCAGQDALVRTVGAEQEPITGEDGKLYQVGLDVTAARVQLSFLGEDGGQRTRYAIDGDDLLLTKEIVSSWFESPVQWTVRYRKAE
jgi:hypothetical protein